jgi:hypothetical protein
MSKLLCFLITFCVTVCVACKSVRDSQVEIQPPPSVVFKKGDFLNHYLDTLRRDLKMGKAPQFMMNALIM